MGGGRWSYLKSCVGGEKGIGKMREASFLVYQLGWFRKAYFQTSVIKIYMLLEERGLEMSRSLRENQRRNTKGEIGSDGVQNQRGSTGSVGRGLCTGSGRGGKSASSKGTNVNYGS